MSLALWIVGGAFVAFAGHFAILVAQKGWGWGLAKIKAWWNVGKSDLADLKGDVTTLKADVDTLKKKVGV